MSHTQDMHRRPHQMSMAAVYWKQDRSSSGALYHRVTTYSVMKFRSELRRHKPSGKC